MHQEITSSYLSVAETLTAHAGVLARGITATSESFARLSDEDKLIYFGVIFGFFKHFESMHCPRFREFLESSPAPKMKTMVDVLRIGS